MNDASDLPLKINPLPQLVYDYQDCLTRGVCLHCSKSLEWMLEIKKNDDRFCSAVCCLTKYSMVPDKVRIIGSFAHPLEDESENEAVLDDDFIKQLREL